MLAPDDPRIPALQLLLDGLTTKERQRLFHLAFPNEFIMLRSGGENALSTMRLARAVIREATTIADGTGGLGVLAAQKLNVLLVHADSRVAQAAGILNMDL